MSSNIPSLSDIIQSSPTNANVLESPIVPGSRRSSRRFQKADEDETLLVLSRRRDELIRRRKELQEQVNAVQLKILNFDPEAKDDETIEVRKRKSGNEELDKLRSNLNRLPIIGNWDLRLQLLKMFQPNLKIEIKLIRVNNGIKEIEYDMKYYKLFQISMSLSIDLKEEKIINFNTNYNHNTPSELSQYISKCENITFAIYSINSYVQLMTAKINLWLQIFDKYHDKYTINDLKSSNELINYLKLKNESILTIKSVDRQLNIIWKFEVNEFAEFETVIRCIVVDNKITTNYDELINEMIRNDGVYRGLCSIIDNALN